MSAWAGILLAVLSIWDYPARQPRHEALRDQFITAVRTGDTKTMEETCRAGVELLPDDPTWHYNLACSLAYFKDPEPALAALQKAIDFGFCDSQAISADNDLKRLAHLPRFKELVEYAEENGRKPFFMGPLAAVPATGSFGEPLVLGAHNLSWDFDVGCFVAKMTLSGRDPGGNCGDLYMNRDENHSLLAVTNWPGLTQVRLDREGRGRKMDVDFPNILFPYPVFGNASRGLPFGPYWRSLPRALMTVEARRMKAMHKFYTSNQIWVFPAVRDYNFTTNGFGDVFASVTPYWFATEGISWSDQYYLKAALTASRAFTPMVKQDLVRRGLLAPTIQMLIRRSLRKVKTDDDYFGPLAHPTCFPPNGLDLNRLAKSAAELTMAEIPPLVTIAGVGGKPTKEASVWPELTYATPCAWALVLRCPDEERVFDILAAGALEYRFAAVHDEKQLAKIEHLRPDLVRVTVDRRGMTPTNRVDIAVFGRNPGTRWSAPGFVSLAVVDPKAPYSDPALTPQEEPAPEEQ
ncbi:MAG: tetratricopeptide repeat protein [Kiritimatiellia bacterium]